jgi:hypothetical protein
VNIYAVSVIVGAAGFGVMAAGGLGHHSHPGAATPGHAGHGALHHGPSAAGLSHGLSRTVLALMSPRLLFAFLLGFGVVGLAVHALVAGTLLLVIALAGGVAVERLLVRPVWNLALRFASNPALTLESAVTSEGTAVTAFDASGNGIVSLEIDGQVVQLLGSVAAGERERAGRIRAGDRVLVEDVDTVRNRCTVSVP